MSPEQIELARHALGLPNKKSVSYRRYFVTGKNSPDYAHWNDMVSAGEATVRRKVGVFGGDDIFYLTRKGAEAALKPGERLDPEDWS